MALLHGIDRGTGEATNIESNGPNVPQCGIPITPVGALWVSEISGAQVGLTRMGVQYANDGSMYVTLDAVGIVKGGVAYTTAGVVCETVSAPANGAQRAFIPGIGVVLVDVAGRVYVS